MDEHEQALRRQLASLFAEELADRVDELRRVAGALDDAPASADARAALHRALHVVKGASRSVGEEAIEAACHRLETQLAAVTADQLVPTALVYELADALEDARGALRAGAATSANRFARIGSDEPAPLDEEAPAPSDGGDDDLRIAASALDELVAQSAAVLQARQSLTPVLAAFEQLREEARRAEATTAPRDAVTERQWRRSFDRTFRGLAASVERIVRSSEILDDQIRRLRLRPFDEVVSGCARIAREAAAAVGKQVELTIHARGVQLDRVQVEGLRDVMVQLVRNAVAHGIEDPATRLAAGKPERGEITVEATARGDALTIQVRDDGAGLNVAWLERLARERGLPVEEPRALARLIFEPGVSSAAAVTELAGRGVGLDVVRQRVERLHGVVRAEWVAGGGTTFIIDVPITVATLRSLIVESAGTSYALPITAVERLLWVAPADVRRGEARELVRVGDDWLVVVSLDALLGDGPGRFDRRAQGLVVSQGGRRIVLTADRIVDAIEIAFETLDPRLGRVRGIAGATTLPDGAVALILHASELIDAALGTSYRAVFPDAPVTRAARTVLLADDSATTRALEANILRAAGYVVRTAVDGEDAWRLLQEERSDVIVSDVDMPRLSGFELTERVRAAADLASIPVILVSARGTDADKARGMRAGANAYLIKSSFDQTVLLETLARLV